MSCLSSVRFAAATIGSTCSGRRKPTMAPFTAGLRRVQATATAPGVVLWRAATSRSRSTSSRCWVSWGSRNSSLRRRQSSRGQCRDPLPRHCAGKQAVGHRRVHDHPDPFPLGDGEDLHFDPAVDRVVRCKLGLRWGKYGVHSLPAQRAGRVCPGLRSKADALGKLASLRYNDKGEVAEERGRGGHADHRLTEETLR